MVTTNRAAGSALLYQRSRGPQTQVRTGISEMTGGRSEVERKVKLSSRARVLELIQTTLWAISYNHFNSDEINSSIFKDISL